MLSLVLGLGNIGEDYKFSRHNTGFQVIEQLLKINKLEFEPATGEYDWAVKETDVAKIFFALPKTYINRSGTAANVLLQRLNLEPSQMLVVVDDFNLPLGRIRIRKFGSDGGHNGLESIIEELGTENFPRIRMGIGPLPENIEAAEFVLSNFENEEIESVEKMIDIASEAVMYSLEHNLEEAMLKYNSNPV